MDPLTICLCAFYALQGWLLSFSGMAMLLQTKWVSGNDPAFASALQAAYVAGWYLKPLYGLAFDRAARRKVGGRCSFLTSSMTWCYVGTALSASASVGLACVSVGLDSTQTNCVTAGSDASEICRGGTEYRTLYVFCSVLVSVGASVQDVVMDAVQVRWVKLVDTTGREGSGGGVQSVTWRGRFLASAVGGVAGSVIFSKWGGILVHLLQACVQGILVPACIACAQQTNGYLESVAVPKSTQETPVAAEENLQDASQSDKNDEQAVDASPQTQDLDNTTASSALAGCDEQSDEMFDTVDTLCESEERMQTLQQAGEAEQARQEEQLQRRRQRVLCISVGVFMFFFNASPSVGAIWSYYLLSEVNIAQTTLGIVGAVGGISAAVGAWLYDYLDASRVSRRFIVCLSSIVGFILGFDVYIVLYRVGQGWLGFDWGSQYCAATVLSVGAVLGGLLSGFTLIPIQHATAMAMPGGEETASFAVVMAVHNAAGGISELLGAFLARTLGVSESSYGEMSWLLFICNLLGLLSATSVVCLPNGGGVTGTNGYALTSDQDNEPDSNVSGTSNNDDSTDVAWPQDYCDEEVSNSDEDDDASSRRRLVGAGVN